MSANVTVALIEIIYFISLKIMGFLFPEFLFWLLLIAVPVIIHLFNFRRFKKIYFTNLNFLKEIQVQTASAKNLKERLILACRVLAIVFLVLAFAQPFFKNQATLTNFQKNVVSVYLDNSYSMEAVNKNGTLLAEAKRKAKDVANAYGLNDRFQLLTNNFSSKSQQLLTKDEFLEALEETKITPLVRSYQTIINQQQNFLRKQRQANCFVYLVSDFQQQEVFKQSIKKDSDITFTLIPLLANTLPNVSLDSVYFLSPFHRANQSESLVYKLTNHSDKLVENVPVSLKISGVQKAIGNSSIKANNFVLDTLRFSGLQGNWQRATLSIKDYPITFDDQLHFTFQIQNHLKVAAIYEDEAVKNIGIAYRTDPFFEFTEIDQKQINYSELAKQQTIILENLIQVPDGLAQQLKKYVQTGGSLVVFIPLKADLGSYKHFLKSLETDIPISLETNETKATQLNLSHPVFKDVFDAPPKNIDLPVAKQYFKSSDFTKTTRQVLLSGNTSGNLLNAYQLGKGKTYVSFLPLEAHASNFAQHAVFLPILFKTALLSSIAQPLFHTLGSIENVAVPAVVLTESQSLHVKGEGVDIIPSYQRSEMNSSIYFADQLQKAGFYEVVLKDSLLSAFALNEDRKESDLSFYQNDELAEKFDIPASNIISSKEKVTSQQIKEVNLKASLWKLCLILSLIFLAAEVLLIRYYRNPHIKSKTVTKSA